MPSEALVRRGLHGLVANAAFGWYWADPPAGFVIAYYALREAASVLVDRLATG